MRLRPLDFVLRKLKMQKGLNKPGASLNDRPVRVLKFNIENKYEGFTVREYLNQIVKLSQHQISSLKFRADGIVVNGRTRRVTCILKENDILEIGLKDAGSAYLDPGDFTAPPDILYEDEDILVVNKKPGMVCHPSPGHYCDTVANQVAAYCRMKNENWTIRLIGRLDMDTSGILLFAKNSETAAMLTRQRNEGRIEKIYLAVCDSIIEDDKGKIEKRIARDEEKLGKMKISEDGKEAATYYKVLQRTNNKSLISVRIEHGRTHQIRIHMASIGHPLEGDSFYGNGICNKDYAALHAYKSSFIQPFTGEHIEVTAPIPQKINDEFNSKEIIL